MSEKKRKSAAVESGEKPPWPVEDVVFGMTFLFLGSLGIMRWLNILDPRRIWFIGDVIHMTGAIFLGVTLIQKDACAGLSLKSLHPTALHLAFKVSYAGLVLSELRPLDINSILGTLGAIYMLIPCALLSLLIHPTAPENSWSRITVAFCCYLNSISMLPQLQVMRKREILLTRGQSVTFLGYDFVGYDNIWWAVTGVLSEIVNGFVLADFCYYYVTIHFDVGREDMRLPSGVL